MWNGNVLKFSAEFWPLFSYVFTPTILTLFKNFRWNGFSLFKWKFFYCWIFKLRLLSEYPVVIWSGIWMVVWNPDWKKPVESPKCLVFEWSYKSPDFTIWIPDTHTVRYSGVQNSDGYCYHQYSNLSKVVLLTNAPFFKVILILPFEKLVQFSNGI